MVFAGDEIGLRGTLGEDARTPYPWNHEDTWDRHTLDTYRDLAALRRDCRALRHGGLRWVAAAGDALAYLRECPDERLMVLALRAACPALQVPAWLLGLTGEAPNVFGGAAALRAAAGGDVALPGDGLTYQVWRLG
jgi:alpha-glucosidase